MRQFTIHEAKTQLSKLIQAALQGEDIIIAKGKQPLVRLKVLPEAKGQRQPGNARGLIIEMSDDFDQPLTDFDLTRLFTGQ